MDEEAIKALEVAAASASSKAMFGGSAGAVLGFVASSQFIALAGLLIGIVGLLVNVYFRARSDRRDQEEHNVRMAKLSRESVPAMLQEHRQQEEADPA